MRCIIHRTHRNNRYTTINVTAVEDNRLSGLAKAVHLYAMSRPDGWDLNTTDIINRFKEGKDAIYAAMQNLKVCGYLELPDKKKWPRGENGKYLSVEAHWYEEPIPVKPETAKPETVQPEPVQPVTVNPTHSINHSSINHSSNDQDISGGPVCAWCTKPINSLLQRIHDAYKEQFDRCPTIVPAKDNAALKRLKDTGKSEAAIIATYRKYLTLDDQWFKGKGYNIATFVGNYDGIVTRQQGRKPQADESIAERLERMTREGMLNEPN